MKNCEHDFYTKSTFAGVDEQRCCNCGKTKDQIQVEEKLADLDKRINDLKKQEKDLHNCVNCSLWDPDNYDWWDPDNYELKDDDYDDSTGCDKGIKCHPPLSGCSMWRAK